MLFRLTKGLPVFLLAAGVSCGCERAGGPKSGPAAGTGSGSGEAAAAPGHAADAQDRPGAAGEPTKAEQSDSYVGKQTNEVVDAREAVKDPNWSVAASDPQEVRAFTASGTALNRMNALAGEVNLGQWVQQEHALNDRYPSYRELRDYIARNNVRMPALREYQHYGYDETTGDVVILENRAEKEARRAELGLSPDE